jgi:long-chain acyl-CoA synthetase
MTRADFRDFPRMLEEISARHGDAEALREPGDGWRSVSYSALCHDALAFSSALLARGGGRVVGVSGRNSASWASVYLGTLAAGGVIVPIDRELPHPEMRAILHYAGADLFVLDRSLLDDRGERTGAARHPGLLVMNSGGECPPGAATLEDFVSGRAPRAAEIPDPGAPAAIYYTSGTMGSAKGVVLSQANILSVVRQMHASFDLGPGDVFLSILPMHHTYECSCGFLGALACGAGYVISRGLKHVGEDIAASGATVVLAVPLLWEAVHRRIMDGIRSRPGGMARLGAGLAVAGAAGILGIRGARRRIFSQVHDRFGGRIRLLISGGAAVDPEVSRRFISLGFEFLQGYGLTEAAPLLSVNRPGANRPESVGPPLPEVELRIDEPSPDGVGEVLARGPNIMLGYHEDPGETSRTITPDGWLRTGDYGRIDRDGFLYLTGRKKNVIVAKNGKNVYPEELEQKLNRSRLVLESMVFGRECRDKGEDILAVVVPDMDRLVEEAEGRGASLSPGLAKEVVAREIRSLNSQQPVYKRISGFVLSMDELPKTTTRKIRRRDVLRSVGLEPGTVEKV